jgi:hypothetical protein
VKSLTESEMIAVLKMAAQVTQECFVPALQELYKDSIREYQVEIVHTRAELKQLRQDVTAMQERQVVEFKVLKAGVQAVALQQFRTKELE